MDSDRTPPGPADAQRHPCWPAGAPGHPTRPCAPRREGTRTTSAPHHQWPHHRCHRLPGSPRCQGGGRARRARRAARAARMRLPARPPAMAPTLPGRPRTRLRPGHPHGHHAASTRPPHASARLVLVATVRRTWAPGPGHAVRAGDGGDPGRAAGGGVRDHDLLDRGGVTTAVRPPPVADRACPAGHRRRRSHRPRRSPRPPLPRRRPAPRPRYR
jgi:hypothetical protein